MRFNIEQFGAGGSVTKARRRNGSNEIRVQFNERLLFRRTELNNLVLIIHLILFHRIADESLHLVSRPSGGRETTPSSIAESENRREERKRVLQFTVSG